MSEMLALPAGHALEGFVHPDLSFTDGAGLPPQEELDAASERDQARQADADAVAQHEHDTATAIRDDRLDFAKLKMTAIEPTWCSVADTELVLLRVFGNGFSMSSKILFAGQEEPITFVSENEITTWVTPWIFFENTSVPVSVRETAIGSEGDAAETIFFTFWP